ncbi:MAG TPA: sigma-70 family RNA polymerase sigma factor [Tepidisphaeraceae bacterium]|nr:sigma-70 family RNA polymerase sigma factor [Tepidisphaeraceae bacterium]
MSLTSDEFERLALAELDPLYRMARRLTRDSNRADDLVQETYARALRSRDNFSLQQFGIKPWLLRIMYNLHLNRADRARREPQAVEDDALEAGANAANSDGADLPIDPSSFQAMDEQLVHALDDLPEDYRAIVLLWAVEELSYKEIATALDIPIGTVMSRLHRARHRLAEHLREYAVTEGIIRE